MAINRDIYLLDVCVRGNIECRREWVIRVRCLAISGSLRKHSSNSNLLKAAQQCAPPGVQIDIYDGLADLPHFNPDLDPTVHESVQCLIEKMRSADGLIVSTPEYAHGIPGSLKNALDWLVNTDAFIEKPFVLLNISARSAFAQQSLIEVLKTMSGIEVEGASATIPLLGKSVAPSAILEDPNFRETIQKSIEVFAAAIRKRRTEASGR